MTLMLCLTHARTIAFHSSSRTGVWRWLTSALLVLCSLAWSAPNAHSQCTNVYVPGTTLVNYLASPTNGGAQTFVPTTTGQVCEVQHGVDGINGGITAYNLYIVSAPGVGAPPMNYASTYLFRALNQTSFRTGLTLGKVAVTNGLTLTAGQRYAIIIVPVTGRVLWGGNNSNTYTSGQSWFLFPSWIAAPAPIDYAFRVMGPVPPPNNNNCASCVTVGLGSYSGTLAGATTDGSSTCGGVNDVWYCFNAPCAGQYTVSTCGSSIDTVVSVHSACGGVQIACNDDCPGTPCLGSDSCTTFTAACNTSYRIRVATFDGAVGPFNLTITQSPLTAPSNNDIANAITVGNVTNLPFTNCGATTDGPAGCWAFNDIWYRYQPNCQGTVSIDTCGSGFDSYLAVYTGAPGSLSLVSGTCNDDNGPLCGGLQSSIRFAGNPCTNYYVRVGGWNSSTGCGDLTISCAQTAPPNDLCSAPVSIAPGLTYGTTVGATASGAGTFSPGPCGSSATTADVWYAFTPSCNGQITLDTCGLPCVGARYDAVLSLHTGTCGSVLNTLACNDDASCGTGYNLSARIVANVTGGVNYKFRVSGYNGRTGNFALQLAYTAAATPNDSICNALVAPCGTSAFSTCGSTTSPEPTGGCPMFNDTWYRFTTPNCAAPVTISTCTSPMDTSIAVYSGACASPTFIACNNDAAMGSPCAGSAQSFVSFVGAPSTTYYVRVGSPTNGVFGNGVLNITCPPGLLACPPAPPASAKSRLFNVQGVAANASWAFRMTIPCCFDLYVPFVPGVTPSTNTDPLIAQQEDEAALAQRFVDAINGACPQSPDLATAYPFPQVGTYGCFGVKAGHCNVIDPNSGQVFRARLYIGPAFTPVDELGAAADSGNLPTTGAVSFNPELEEIVTPGDSVDCNGNGEDDLVDVLNGTSLDLNGNNVPDECDPPPAPKSYCTAGTTTNGCLATMSSTGTPSAAASSGYTLSVTNVEGQKQGLLYYGINGGQETPWANGSPSFQCVKAPRQRMGVLVSGGTAGTCNGTFNVDFLAYCATHPGSLGTPLASGLVVTAQAWFRDPPAPKATNLSDGLEFTIVP